MTRADNHDVYVNLSSGKTHAVVDGYCLCGRPLGNCRPWKHDRIITCHACARAVMARRRERGA